MRFINIIASAALTLATQVPLRESTETSTELSEVYISETSPAYRNELLALHKALVDISSTSRNESTLGEYLLSYLSAHGFATKVQPIVDAATAGESDSKTRFNIVAWPSSLSQPNGNILLTSHIDVVPPPVPYWIDPGPVTGSTRIGGRGSVDAKGSVSAQIIALRQLLEGGLDPAAVTLLYVVGEEINGDGMEVFSESVLAGTSPVKGPVKAAIFGEPTEGKLACGHKGGLYCSIEAKGRAAHSGYPWLGHSATESLVLALAKIVTTDLGSSEKYGNTTVNIGTISGGVASNVVAASASAQIGIRVAIGPTKTGGQIVQKRVESILESVDEGLSLDCPISSYGVVECDCKVDGFETAIENYGTDMPHLNVGQVNYLYGPGSIFVAHGDNENLAVSDLETAVEDFKKLVNHAISKF